MIKDKLVKSNPHFSSTHHSVIIRLSLVVTNLFIKKKTFRISLIYANAQLFMAFTNVLNNIKKKKKNQRK